MHTIYEEKNPVNNYHLKPTEQFSVTLLGKSEVITVEHVISLLL